MAVTLGAVSSAAPPVLHPTTQSSRGGDPGLSPQLEALTRGFIRQEVVLDAGLTPDLSVTFLLPPDAAERSPRLIAATQSTLRRLSEWFGPFPHPQLTVIGAPWHGDQAGAAFPGVVVTTSRWLEPAIDRTPERSLIAAVARQYWMTAAVEPARRWLSEGLTLYSAVRAIHAELEIGHFATLRLFGGFVPLTLRAVRWSTSPTDPRPRLRHFAEVDEPAEASWRQWSAAPASEAQRVALALHTLERYVGWPAMQQMLAALQERKRVKAIGPDDLAAIMTEQRGRDTSWFFSEALRFDAHFDHGITAFTSDGGGAQPGFHTHLEVRRHGDGLFTGTSEPVTPPFKSGRSVPVVVRFEDGTSVREWWDVRDAVFTRDFEGPSRAIGASVDPDAVLLLETDRANNSRVLDAGIDDEGAWLAARWVVWLQDLMLSCTGLL
jgi:hypothetical protein